MKYKAILLVMLLPIMVFAQGIKFRTFKTWDEVLKEAKSENKYIFMDCHATWCGPCKKMDVEVFKDVTLGEFINANFISMKFQIDTTARDDQYVKDMHIALGSFAKEYKIRSLPTYLFFSPEGKIVAKEEGFVPVKAFLQIASDVLDPQKQYYTLLAKYGKGGKDFDMVKKLIEKSIEKGENEEAVRLTKIYVEQYLLKMPEDSLFTADRLSFLAADLSVKNRNAFNIFYKNSDKIDKVVKINGWAAGIVEKALINEYILLKSSNEEPNWININKVISDKYAKADVKKVMLRGKIEWYKKHKNGNNNLMKLANARIENWEHYGVDTTNFFNCVGINNICSNEILPAVTDKEMLKIAIKYMGAVVRHFPVKEEKPTISAVNFVDTYASLLYKSGQLEDAIAYQEKAVKWWPKEKSFANNLEKMRKNEPTW